jgi:hypothetical protein
MSNISETPQANVQRTGVVDGGSTVPPAPNQVVDSSQDSTYVSPSPSPSPSESFTAMSPYKIGGNCMLRRGGRRSLKKHGRKSHKKHGRKSHKKHGRKSHKKHGRK